MGNSGAGNSLCFDAFSLREPEPTSLENAMEPNRTKPDSGKRLMTGALMSHPHLWRWGGGSMATIRQQRHPAQKSTLNRKTCGKKATASLPQRRTDVQALE
jgi:hypothetical protein